MTKIKLIDVSEKLVLAWKESFKNYPDVEIIHDSILKHPCDAIISPSNSFGIMQGGIDLIYANYFGVTLQDNLQDKICKMHNGELLVGETIIMETYNNTFPYLISAPTMRIPGSRLIGTPNVYLAAKAIFIILNNNLNITSVAIPGLGTGTGAVSPEECARLMRMAYEDWYLGEALTNGVNNPGSLSEVFSMCDEQTVKQK